MLHFVTGIAGTGKTTCLYEKIEQVVRAGGRAILLVPEQLSFESERHLYRTLGPSASLGVEVLSFTRLCNMIFRELGGLAKRPVTPAAKYLLMSIALKELQDSLRVYKKSTVNTDFLQTLVQVCAEFKAGGILPDQLEAAAHKCSGPLCGKLQELSGIYAAYQSLLEKGYSDGDDDLIRACALLENADYFGGYTVFVDGFTTFMAAEFELLGHIIAQADDIWLALTCDTLQDAKGGMGLFSPVQEAAARLTQYAARDGIPVAPQHRLEAPVRYRSGALRHIAEHFMRGSLPASEACEGLRVFHAQDRYMEIEAVAASILQLVREEGLRYRDIAVVARETSPYTHAIDAIFERCGIPFFSDNPKDVESHPLVAAILHAIDAIRGNYDTEAILLLAKSPVLGLELQAVARLENYCYCWSVRGAAWKQDFVAHPRGLAGILEEEDVALLQEINELRARVAEPLLTLQGALDSGDGRAFAAGLYDFLLAVHAPEHITEYAELLGQDAQATFLAESAQVWDAVIGILDVFGAVLGGVRMARARLCELLRLSIGTTETSLPPQTLDQVLVGKADRIRPVHARAVFVIGAVEGEFPAQVRTGGVFSDAERQQMADSGLEIAAPNLRRAVLEKFFAYYAVTLAAERLFVSCPRADLQGKELLPSVILAQLAALFPSMEKFAPDAAYHAAGKAAAREQLSRELGHGTVLEATLREYLAEDPALAKLEHLRAGQTHRIDRQLARGLFGRRMRLSPTRVERYFRCPFSYFAADGLAIKKRKKVEFTPLESGSVIHDVLHVMVQRHGGKGLAALEESLLEQEISAVIEGYLSERVESLEILPPRLKHQYARLTKMLVHLLRRIGREFAQSEFSPAAFELPISWREGVEPLRMRTVDGTSVVVEGFIDRVDIMEKNGKKYVRVIDYKSGEKDFALVDILYGLNMQMLLYLFTIRENGRRELADCIPAGVLYMPVQERFVSAGRDTPDEKVAAERDKQWRMSGLLLEDEEALRGMERDLAGIFIPAKLGRNGLDAKSALVNQAEMGMLARKIREQVVAMAEALSDGAIEAKPTFSEDYRSCDYCDYRAVCGYEAGGASREVPRLDHKKVLERIEREQEGE